MATIETIKIQDGTDYRIINKSKYNPAEHKLWVPIQKKEQPKVTKEYEQEKPKEEKPKEVKE